MSESARNKGNEMRMRYKRGLMMKQSEEANRESVSAYGNISMIVVLACVLTID